jgi:hypothetical protein
MMDEASETPLIFSTLIDEKPDKDGHVHPGAPRGHPPPS